MGESNDAKIWLARRRLYVGTLIGLAFVFCIALMPLDVSYICIFY